LWSVSFVTCREAGSTEKRLAVLSRSEVKTIRSPIQAGSVELLSFSVSLSSRLADRS
jgi:hypothetical protein